MLERLAATRLLSDEAGVRGTARLPGASQASLGSGPSADGAQESAWVASLLCPACCSQDVLGPHSEECSPEWVPSPTLPLGLQPRTAQAPPGGNGGPEPAPSSAFCKPSSCPRTWQAQGSRPGALINYRSPRSRACDAGRVPAPRLRLLGCEKGGEGTDRAPGGDRRSPRRGQTEPREGTEPWEGDGAPGGAVAGQAPLTPAPDPPSTALAGICPSVLLLPVRLSAPGEPPCWVG